MQPSAAALSEAGQIIRPTVGAGIARLKDKVSKKTPQGNAVQSAACALEAPGPFPVQAVVAAFVVVLKLDEKKGRDRRTKLLKECVMGLDTMVQAGFITQATFEQPAWITGAGQPLTDAVIVSLAAHVLAAKNSPVQCSVLKCLEHVCVSRECYASGVHLFSAFEKFFRAWIGDPDVKVREQAQQSLENSVRAVLSRLEGESTTEGAAPAARGQQVTESDLLASVPPSGKDVYLLLKTMASMGVESLAEVSAGDPKMRSRQSALHVIQFALGCVEKGMGMSASIDLVTLLKGPGGLVRCIAENLCAATPQALFDHAVGILQHVVCRFGPFMKREVQVLLLHLLLPIARSPLCPFSQRMTVLKGLEDVCSDSAIVVELFLNHDGAAHGQPVLENIMATAAFVAAHDFTSQGWVTPHQALVMRHAAADVLSTAVQSVDQWVQRTGPRAGRMHREPPASAFRERRMRNLSMRKARFLFRSSWKAGMRELYRCGFVEENPVAVSRFLHNDAPRLGFCPSQTGELLLGAKEFSRKTWTEYLRMLDFRGLTVDQALRRLMRDFRPPGEGQIIDRMLSDWMLFYSRDNSHLDLVQGKSLFHKAGVATVLLMDEVQGVAVPLDQRPLPVSAVCVAVADVPEDKVAVRLQPPLGTVAEPPKAKEEEEAEEGATKGEDVIDYVIVDRGRVRNLDPLYVLATAVVMLNTTMENPNIERQSKEFFCMQMAGAMLTYPELRTCVTESNLKQIWERLDAQPIRCRDHFRHMDWGARQDAVQSVHAAALSTAADYARATVAVPVSKAAVVQAQAEYQALERQMELAPQDPAAAASEKTVVERLQDYQTSAGKLSAGALADVFSNVPDGPYTYWVQSGRAGHAGAIVEAIWGQCAVGFVAVLDSTANSLLAKQVADAQAVATQLAAHFGIDTQSLREAAENAQMDQKRWMRFHGLKPFPSRSAPSFAAVSSLYGF